MTPQGLLTHQSNKQNNTQYQPPPIPWMVFFNALVVKPQGAQDLAENTMEVIVKTEKTNTMTNTWERQRQRQTKTRMPKNKDTGSQPSTE